MRLVNCHQSKFRFQEIIFIHQRNQNFYSDLKSINYVSMNSYFKVKWIQPQWTDTETNDFCLSLVEFVLVNQKMIKLHHLKTSQFPPKLNLFPPDQYLKMALKQSKILIKLILPLNLNYVSIENTRFPEKYENSV